MSKVGVNIVHCLIFNKTNFRVGDNRKVKKIGDLVV